jgi:hypothetical protein
MLSLQFIFLPLTTTLENNTGPYLACRPLSVICYDTANSYTTASNAAFVHIAMSMTIETAVSCDFIGFISVTYALGVGGDKGALFSPPTIICNL